MNNIANDKRKYTLTYVTEPSKIRSHDFGFKHVEYFNGPKKAYERLVEAIEEGLYEITLVKEHDHFNQERGEYEDRILAMNNFPTFNPSTMSWDYDKLKNYSENELNED